MIGEWQRSVLLIPALLAAAGCATVPAPAPVAVPEPVPPAAYVFKPAPAIPPANPEGRGAAGILAYATSLQGVHYRNGGTSPITGFDCSGFVQYVYGRLGVSLPHNSRAMARELPAVAPVRMRPGDLVFFRINGRPHSHVGIYLGDRQFVHATSHRTNIVMVSNLDDRYWRRRLDGVRRPAPALSQE